MAIMVAQSTVEHLAGFFVWLWLVGMFSVLAFITWQSIQIWRIRKAITKDRKEISACLIQAQAYYRAAADAYELTKH